tara:strand:+ start:221 stop:475 length:255 start_codon:yes stop_codon:yes gene_type:complete
MDIPKIIDSIRTKNVKAIAYFILGLLVIIDFFIPRNKVHFFGDSIPGFWALFGLIACILIIIVSKWIGHLGLLKDENYYGDLEE